MRNLFMDSRFDQTATYKLIQIILFFARLIAPHHHRNTKFDQIVNESIYSFFSISNSIEGLLCICDILLLPNCYILRHKGH